MVIKIKRRGLFSSFENVQNQKFSMSTFDDMKLNVKSAVPRKFSAIFVLLSLLSGRSLISAQKKCHFLKQTFHTKKRIGFDAFL